MESWFNRTYLPGPTFVGIHIIFDASRSSLEKVSIGERVHMWVSCKTKLKVGRVFSRFDGRHPIRNLRPSVLKYCCTHVSVLTCVQDKLHLLKQCTLPVFNFMSLTVNNICGFCLYIVKLNFNLSILRISRVEKFTLWFLRHKVAGMRRSSILADMCRCNSSFISHNVCFLVDSSVMTFT